MNKNTETCINAALDQAYLEGYSDGKNGKLSRIAMAIRDSIAKIANAEQTGQSQQLASTQNEFLGKWLTEGGLFVELERREGDKYIGYQYSLTGQKMALVPYDLKGNSEYGKAYNVKERLSGTAKEGMFPTLMQAVAIRPGQ